VPSWLMRIFGRKTRWAKVKIALGVECVGDCDREMMLKALRAVLRRRGVKHEYLEDRGIVVVRICGGVAIIVAKHVETVSDKSYWSAERRYLVAPVIIIAPENEFSKVINELGKIRMETEKELRWKT